MRTALFLSGCLAAMTLGLSGALPLAAAQIPAPTIRMAAGPEAGAHSDPRAAAERAAGDKDASDKDDDSGDDKELTPEQVMQKRFPQSVRTGFLVGLPLLDFDDSTIGYISQVVRTPDGKIKLIVPYRSLFGWSRVEWGKRPVAVPIETVVILARQLDAIDFVREDFDKAPTWTAADGRPIPPEETIKIAIGRR